MTLRCGLCGLETDDLRIVSRAIVRLDEAEDGKSYDWQPRCRDRRACSERIRAVESANDDVVLA